MTVKEMLNQELMSEIKQLSSYRLQEVLDFVRFLGTRPTPVYERPELKVDLTKDPILEFAGGVSHGALAQGIDEELTQTASSARENQKSAFWAMTGGFLHRVRWESFRAPVE